MKLQIGWPVNSIPNANGFRFRGVLENGDLINCYVQQDDSLIFRVYAEESGDNVFKLLRGWMQHLPKSKDDQS